MSYQPPVNAWGTTIFDVVYVADRTYTVIVKPIDVNEPGAANSTKNVGDYIKDFVGNSYIITEVDVETNLDYVEGRVWIYDELNWGVGPQSGQPAIVYSSVQEGNSPFVAPVRNDRLDDSSLHNTREFELDIMWKHRGFREETNNADNITSVELGGNIISSIVEGGGWRGGRRLVMNTAAGYEYWKLTEDLVAFVSKYGYSYNWFAATDVRNITSLGWKMPTDAEWTILTNYLGGVLIAGGKLKEIGTSHWNSPNTDATNITGFTARPGGYRSYNNGSFNGIGGFCYFWSSTEYDTNSAWSRGIYNMYASVNRYNDNKKSGFSVRPLKESTTLTDGQTGTYIGNDGHVYPTICIGTQEWVSENIFETKYRNGDLIPIVTDNTAWAALTTGARASYLNDESNAIQPVVSPGIRVHDKDFVNFTDTPTVTWSISEVSGSEIEVKANATAGIGGSGTPGYLPKWLTGGVTLGDSPAYTDGTNIGFGATTGMTHKVEIVSASHYPLQIKGSYGGGLVFGDDTQFTFPYGGGIWAVGLTPSNSNYSFATSPGGITNLNIPSGGVSINFQVGGSEKFGMFGSGGVYVGSGYSGSDPGAGKLIVENMLGVGVFSVSARLHLLGSASTTGIPSMRIDPGTLLTTPYSGNVESDGTHIYWTSASGTRYPLDTTGGGGISYPSGTGIPTVITGTSWGTTLSASGNSLKYLRVKTDESGFEFSSAVYSVATSGAITGGTITGSGTIGHSSADGYRHVPSGGTSNVGKFLMATAVDGVYTWDSPTTGGDGTVTSVAAGDGMSFTTFTTSGAVAMGTPVTISSTTTNSFTTSPAGHTHELNVTGVTAGSYTYATITVDAKGRITAASSGTTPGGGGIGYPSSGLVIMGVSTWDPSLSQTGNSLKEVRVKEDESNFELFTPLWKREGTDPYVLSPFTANDVVDVWSNSTNPTIGGNNTSGTGTNNDGGVAVYGYSSNGIGMFGYSVYDLGGAFAVRRGTTSDVVDVLEISRGLASGTLAIGIGESMAFRLQSDREDPRTHTISGRFSNSFTNITVDHESAKFQWSLIDDGVVDGIPGLKMELYGSGKLRLNKYGTASPFVGTAVKFLAVDSSGYVIEETVPTGSIPGAGIPLSSGSSWSTSFAASVSTANMSIRVDSEGAMWEWFTPAAGMALTDLSALAPILYDNSTGVFSHSASDGSLHVPATSTTNNGKVLMCTAPIAGSIGWAEIPSMTYPSAGIPISTGTSWSTSIGISGINIQADAYTITAIDFTLVSDYRKKTNVSSYQAEAIDVEYKEYELKSLPGEKRYGVIAQDVMKKYPELVSGNEADGYSVRYVDLLVREVANLKEQIKKIKR